jgi:hypothetical protein
MALLTAPAPARPPATKVGVGRLVARARSTPGRLTVLMLVLLAIGLTTGVIGVVGAAQRSSLVDGVRGSSGPLAVQAQELYRSLSDADATAASAFLSNGVEPADLRGRYQRDIAAATAALAAAAGGSAGDQPAIRQISAQLPVYTGLVETARTLNRQGLPLGAAYLREASGLMRGQLLPAAQQLFKFATKQLAEQRGGASSAPWFVLAFSALTLVALLLAQRRLSRLTHRLFSPGLLGATVAALFVVGWITSGWLSVANDLRAANREGSSQVELLTAARIAALQARADEALTLVARGNGAAFENDFTKQIADLSGLLGRARQAATDGAVRTGIDAVVADIKAWQTTHQKLRGIDDGGNFAEAVKLAIGSDKDSAATIFSRLDDTLGQAIKATSAAFDRFARDADGALGGQIPGLVVATALMLVGIAVGFQLRIAEYR